MLKSYWNAGVKFHHANCDISVLKDGADANPIMSLCFLSSREYDCLTDDFDPPLVAVALQKIIEVVHVVEHDFFSNEVLKISFERRW